MKFLIILLMLKWNEHIYIKKVFTLIGETVVFQSFPVLCAVPLTTLWGHCSVLSKFRILKQPTFWHDLLLETIEMLKRTTPNSFSSRPVPCGTKNFCVDQLITSLTKSCVLFHTVLFLCLRDAATYVNLSERSISKWCPHTCKNVGPQPITGEVTPFTISQWLRP